MAVAVILLSGCGANGTAFSPSAKAPVESAEFKEFCVSRDQAGIAVNTAGFFADLLLPQGVQAAASLFRGDAESHLLDNPTTQSLNKKCEVAKELNG